MATTAVFRGGRASRRARGATGVTVFGRRIGRFAPRRPLRTRAAVARHSVRITFDELLVPDDERRLAERRRLFDRLSAADARIAAAEAERIRILAELLEHTEADYRNGAAAAGMHGPASAREWARRDLAAEVTSHGRLPASTGEALVGDAADLVARFGDTVAALADGRINVRHLRVIHRAGAAITGASDRATFEREALEIAETTTHTRLKPRTELVSERIRHATRDDRQRTARAERRVFVTECGNGMSEVFAFVPTILATAIMDRLTTTARDLETADPEVERDDRSIDQRRADVFCELLLTGGPAVVRAAEAHDERSERLGTRVTGDGESGAGSDSVNDGARPLGDGSLLPDRGIDAAVAITIPITALLGDPVHPATLDGSTPVALDDAFALAGRASIWTRVFTDPLTGAVIATDRYRPTEAMRRHLIARDPHCRFPGCRRSARRCDLDHTVAWEHGGRTELCNLACLCRRHHTLKHHTGWRVEHLPGGRLRWISPTGFVFIDDPPPVGPIFAAGRAPSRGGTGGAPRGDPGGCSGDRRGDDGAPPLF